MIVSMLDDAEELFAAAEFHPRGQLGLAAVALDRGDHAVAIDRAERYLRRIPDENRAAMRARTALARSLAALGRTDEAAAEANAALDTAERIGAGLVAERADALLAELVDGTSPRAAHPPTEREVEVLRLVAAGKPNRGIADELVISEKTVARHVSNIVAKLGLSSRAAATAWAYEHAVVQQPLRRTTHAIPTPIWTVRSMRGARLSVSLTHVSRLGPRGVAS